MQHFSNLKNSNTKCIDKKNSFKSIDHQYACHCLYISIDAFITIYAILRYYIQNYFNDFRNKIKMMKG